MIRFRVLGTVELRGIDGAEVRGVLAQPKRVALFAYLVLARPRGFRRRDTLLALFWPESDSDRARNALRQATHFLRQALGAAVFANRGTEDLGISPEAVWCDVTAFEEALDSGDLRSALELYGGDLLRGFFVADAPEFERWLESERTRLRNRAEVAAWTLAEREAAEGNASPATHWGRWASALEPENETGQRRLIELLLRFGDRQAALKAYREFAERLRREFDAEPSAETRALIETAKVGRSAAPSAPPRSAAAPVLSVPPLHRPTRSGLQWGAAAVVAGAIFAGFLWTRAVLEGRTPRPLPPAVAVLPFTIRGHADVSYLREGLVDLLAARLDGAGNLRVIDPNAVLAQTEGDSAPAQARGAAVAHRLGATYFVIGDAVQLAGRLQLTAAIYAADRPTTALAKATAEGEADDVFRLAGETVDQLLVGAVPGADTSLVRLAEATAPSPAAFRAYVDGEAALRAGQYQRAVDAFQRAVAIDSTFALADYRLAVAADWVGDQALLTNSATAAVRHGDRLSSLARSLLAGFEMYSAAQADSAEQIFHQVTTAHPDNLEARYMLGEVWFHYNSMRGRPFTEAREAFAYVLAVDPDHPHALIHLARIAAAEGHREELDTLVDRFLALSPDADRAFELRALQAYARSDTAERSRVTAQLRNAGDAVLQQAQQSVAALDADLSGAIRLAEALEAPGRSTLWQLTGTAARARLEMAAGRWTRAQEAARLIEHRAPDWALLQQALLAATPVADLPQEDLLGIQTRLENWALGDPRKGGRLGNATQIHAPLRLYLLGLITARSGRPDAAARLERLAGALAGLGQRSPIVGYRTMAREMAHALRARAEQLRGDLRAALAEVDQIPFGSAMLIRNLPETEGYERFLRAELLRELGRDDEALQWYASFPSPSAYDIAFLAPAELRQAEIHARRGDRAAAVQHYRRFMRLWRDCDPMLAPVIDSARAALLRLSAPATP